MVKIGNGLGILTTWSTIYSRLLIKTNLSQNFTKILKLSTNQQNGVNDIRFLYAVVVLEHVLLNFLLTNGHTI